MFFFVKKSSLQLSLLFLAFHGDNWLTWKIWLMFLCWFVQIISFRFRRHLAVYSVTWLEMVWLVVLLCGCRLPARRARCGIGLTMWIILLFFRKHSTKVAGQFSRAWPTKDTLVGHVSCYTFAERNFCKFSPNSGK